MTSDSIFIRRALTLAAKGGRAVAPNPMVGAVIVKNGKVIGEGVHEFFGGPHAEVNAIRSVKRKSDLSGSTIYVTLEPCRHHGKTPPCTDALHEAGIARVVCGSKDPFQKKFNRASRRQKGNAADRALPVMEFISGALRQECEKLNRFFFTWVTKKRPFVTVKVAVTADGFVAGANGERLKITSAAQDHQVHRLRAQHQAILVGIGTVLADDPLLNVRHTKGPDPLRVILDSKLRIPFDAKALKDENHLVATCEKRRHPQGINLWISPGKQISLKKLFQHLAARGISSVLAEPGPTLYRALKREGLIDELIVFRGAVSIGEGLSYPEFDATFRLK